MATRKYRRVSSRNLRKEGHSTGGGIDLYVLSLPSCNLSAQITDQLMRSQTTTDGETLSIWPMRTRRDPFLRRPQPQKTSRLTPKSQQKQQTTSLVNAASADLRCVQAFWAGNLRRRMGGRAKGRKQPERRVLRSKVRIRRRRSKLPSNSNGLKRRSSSAAQDERSNRMSRRTASRHRRSRSLRRESLNLSGILA